MTKLVSSPRFVTSEVSVTSKQIKTYVGITSYFYSVGIPSFGPRSEADRAAALKDAENLYKTKADLHQARSRLYQNEILQENMRLTAFFKLYKICILLHRCNLMQSQCSAKICLKNQQFL